MLSFKFTFGIGKIVICTGFLQFCKVGSPRPFEMPIWGWALIGLSVIAVIITLSYRANSKRLEEAKEDLKDKEEIRRSIAESRRTLRDEYLAQETPEEESNSAVISMPNTLYISPLIPQVQSESIPDITDTNTNVSLDMLFEDTLAKQNNINKRIIQNTIRKFEQKLISEKHDGDLKLTEILDFSQKFVTLTKFDNLELEKKYDYMNKLFNIFKKYSREFPIKYNKGLAKVFYIKGSDCQNYVMNLINQKPLNFAFFPYNLLNIYDLAKYFKIIEFDKIITVVVDFNSIPDLNKAQYYKTIIESDEKISKKPPDNYIKELKNIEKNLKQRKEIIKRKKVSKELAIPFKGFIGNLKKRVKKGDHKSLQSVIIEAKQYTYKKLPKEEKQELRDFLHDVYMELNQAKKARKVRQTFMKEGKI